MSVYDDQKTESEAEQLRRITGIGPDEERAMEARAGSDAPAGIKGSGATNTHTPPGASSSSPASLLKAESNPTTNIGGNFASGLNSSFIKKAGGILKTRKGKIAVSGAGGMIGVSIYGAVFLGNLAPVLRVNMFVQKIQDHFYAASEDAADKSANLLLRTYIVKKVMPGMVINKCLSTKVSRSCAAPSDSTNPVGALFSTWKDARLENKLYQRYGIEIIRAGRDSNSFYFRSNKLEQEIFLGEYTPGNTKEFNNSVFAQLNRNEIRQEIRRGLSDETLYKRMKYRFLVGPLLEKKYNIRRCIMACAARDRLDDKIDAKRTAFTSWLNERVVAPRSEMYSLVLDCALSSFDCVNGDEIDSGGQHTSEFERDLSIRLAEYRTRYGESSLNELYETSRDYRTKGATQFFLGKLVGETSAKLAAKGIPIVGWIDLGARLIDGAQNAGAALKKMSTVMYSQTAVATYMMFRVAADETRAGKVDITELGSFSEAMDAHPGYDQGGMAAEDSPVFDAISGSGNRSLASALLPKTYAITKVGPYGCDDKKPLPVTEAGCDEEQVGALTVIGDGITHLSTFASSPMYLLQGFAADAWIQTAGRLVDWAGAAIGALTNIIQKIASAFLPDDWEARIKEISEAIIKTTIGQFIPSQLTDKTSGARYGQIAAAGADFSANDFVHYGMGGRALSDAEVATIRLEQHDLQEAEFSDRSYFARMFSTESPRSFLSQAAVSIPTNFTQFSSSIASAFSNPVKTLSDSFATILPGKNAKAAVIQNPFGITQYGWTDQDMEAVGFADEYWDANCTDLEAFNKAWGEKATEGASGMYENSTTNPCLMIQAGVGMAGGRYNEKLIPETTTTTTAPQATTPAGPIDQTTLFQDSSNIKCASGTNDLGIQDGYNNGKKILIRVCGIPSIPSSAEESTPGNRWYINGANRTSVVNSRVSANLLNMGNAAKADGVTLGASSTFRSMAKQQSLCPCDGSKKARPGFSNHQMGIAIDFVGPEGYNPDAINCSLRVRDNSNAVWKWLNANAAKYGFKQYAKEAWHWDAMVAVNRCGGDGT